MMNIRWSFSDGIRQNKIQSCITYQKTSCNKRIKRVADAQYHPKLSSHIKQMQRKVSSHM